MADVLRHMDYSKYAVDLLLLEDTGDYAAELPPEVHVIFRDLHNTYGSLAGSVRKCITARDWMCLKLRLLFLLRRLIGDSALKPAGAILLGRHHYDCAIGFRPGICSDLVAYSVKADRKITWWHHGEMNVDRGAYAKMCGRMDAVAVVSRACQEMLTNEIPQLSDKTRLIPNMLDSEEVWRKAAETYNQ